MRIALALVRVAQVEAFSKTGLDYDRCLIRSALTIILFNCCAPEFVVYQQFRRLYQISDSAAHSRCASLFPLESSGFQLDELLVIFESKHVLVGAAVMLLRTRTQPIYIMQFVWTLLYTVWGVRACISRCVRVYVRHHVRAQKRGN